MKSDVRCYFQVIMVFTLEIFFSFHTHRSCDLRQVLFSLPYIYKYTWLLYFLNLLPVLFLNIPLQSSGLSIKPKSCDCVNMAASATTPRLRVCVICEEEKKHPIRTASYLRNCRLSLLHITCIDPVFTVSWKTHLHMCVHKNYSQYLLYECVDVSCAFALCPDCYVFWYVAKGRGQAESRTAGAWSGGAAAVKIHRAKGQHWRELGLGQSHKY